MCFETFPKIPRLSRECVITEKIDGTNAQIYILPRQEFVELQVGKPFISHVPIALAGVDFVMLAGSRNRWIAPGSDNFGFARWVWENAEELSKLGPGRHYGEWWGQGIQRGYGLNEKRFSLFNVGRWYRPDGHRTAGQLGKAELCPECCHVVPIVATGDFSTGLVEVAMQTLYQAGSFASSGFNDPEGIVIYHTAAKNLFKKTFKDDEGGKENGPA